MGWFTNIKKKHPDRLVLTPDATIHEVWDSRNAT